MNVSQNVSHNILHSFSVMGWSRSAVLSLYRSLLRKGRQLTLTDKEFYYLRIRKEFETNRNLEKIEDKQRYFEV